jgi:transposase-like protein
VSDHFVRVSRGKLGGLLERPLDKLKLCVLYIDGIEFKGQHLIVALGINIDGTKTVLGLRQGASENATVVGELLDDLVERGVDFSVPMLYVLDGAKALTKAVRKHAGSQALVQRCQLHKRRNVTGHLPEPYRDAVERKMINADQMTHYVDAKKALDRLHRELMDLNPSAARSLAEGMEETLTVHRLQLKGWLRSTLATTNPIESAFSVVDRICKRVKRWRRGDHRERWVGAGLWLAERNFRRVKGYKQLPKLLAELAKLNTPPPAQARAA